MIRIVFPDIESYSKLFKLCDSYCPDHNIKYYKAKEPECVDLLLRNLVDCAFISPLGYGMGVKIADFRVIPGPVVFSQDYTGLASIHFKKGLASIQSLFSPTPKDFPMIIARLLLAEKFGIHLELQTIEGIREQVLENYDAGVFWGRSQSDEPSLDVSEEWFDLIEEPLPLGFWVCRAEDFPQGIVEIVNSIAVPDLPSEESVSEDFVTDSHRITRNGTIFWRWKDEFEEALKSTLLFLYYHQLLEEIPEVKILGRD